ncbi:MAG: hypothetical protein ACI9UK_001660 [Candidatus Krumholzibacteriia bacterium]|jgi:hypothetical protein
MMAASISFNEMTTLMAKMPVYTTYRTSAESAEAERVFRRAMGNLLKECGHHLLAIAEKKSQILSGDMEQTIDALIERIGAIFRRLDREGLVCLVGDCEATINELELLDTRLILLIEDAMSLVRELESDVPAASWFATEARRLSRGLADFSDMTEERNYLLGLGWESEFARKEN